MNKKILIIIFTVIIITTIAVSVIYNNVKNGSLQINPEVTINEQEVTDGIMEQELTQEELDLLCHYNAIVFNEFQGLQADIEGALATKNDIGFGDDGFDIGGAYTGMPPFMGYYENPNNYPSLFLGGLILSQDTDARVYNGNVTMKESNQESYEEGTFRFDVPETVFVNDEIIDNFFNKTKQTIEKTSGILLNGNNTKITEEQFINLTEQDLEQFRNENIVTDLNVLVINVETDEQMAIGEIKLPEEITEYDLIIFNIPAEEVKLTGGAILYNGSIVNTSAPIGTLGNDILKELAEKIVWNIPNAMLIELENYGMIGSVIAPNASVFGIGGSINGMVIAENVIQSNGMEIHAFNINNEIWNFIQEIELGTLEIKLEEMEAEISLRGAIFDLYKETDELWDECRTNIITDNNGEAIVENLEAGKYKLVEIMPPYGCILPEENVTFFELTIDDEGRVMPITLTIANEIIEENNKNCLWFILILIVLAVLIVILVIVIIIIAIKCKGKKCCCCCKKQKKPICD